MRVRRYKGTKLRFLNIPNIHVMRESVRKLHDICMPRSEASLSTSWFSSLENTQWLEYISLILHSALRIVHLIEHGSSVVIHCSDGYLNLTICVTST